MILVPANKVEKIIYFSSLLGLIFIEITRGPFVQFSRQNTSLDTFLTKTWKNGKRNVVKKWCHYVRVCGKLVVNYSKRGSLGEHQWHSQEGGSRWASRVANPI